LIPTHLNFLILGSLVRPQREGGISALVLYVFVAGSWIPGGIASGHCLLAILLSRPSAVGEGSACLPDIASGKVMIHQRPESVVMAVTGLRDKYESTFVHVADGTDLLSRVIVIRWQWLSKTATA
jgi:hypothetical protein